MNMLPNFNKVYILKLVLLGFLIVPFTCSFNGLTQINVAQAKKKSPKKLKRIDRTKKTKTKTKINKSKPKATKKVKVKKQSSRTKKTLKRPSKPRAKATRTQINTKTKAKTKVITKKPKSNKSKRSLSPRRSTRPTPRKGIVTKGKTKGNNRSVLSPKRKRVGKPTRKTVNAPSKAAIKGTSGQRKTTTTTTTKTTKKTTTKRTQKKRVSKKTSKTSNTSYQEDNTVYEDNSGGYAPAPAPAPAPVYGSGASRPINCRPQGGRLMVNAGFGTQNTEGLDDSQPTYMIGVGYRSNLIAIAGEAQFADYNDPSSRSSYRGQLRVYLPVGQCLDLYPLIGLSRFEENEKTTPAIDLGLGADLNLGGSISLGARYTRSFFTDAIDNIRNKEVEASNTMIFQLGLYF